MKKIVFWVGFISIVLINGFLFSSCASTATKGPSKYKMTVVYAYDSKLIPLEEHSIIYIPWQNTEVTIDGKIEGKTGRSIIFLTHLNGKQILYRYFITMGPSWPESGNIVLIPPGRHKINWEFLSGIGSGNNSGALTANYSSYHITTDFLPNHFYILLNEKLIQLTNEDDASFKGGLLLNNYTTLEEIISFVNEGLEKRRK